MRIKPILEVLIEITNRNKHSLIDCKKEHPCGGPHHKQVCDTRSLVVYSIQLDDPLPFIVMYIMLMVKSRRTAPGALVF